MSDNAEANAAAATSAPSSPVQAAAKTSPATTPAKTSRPAPASPEPSSEANGDVKAPKLPPRQRLRTKEGDKELGAPSDDAYSRKRDREGSMEPSSVSAPGMTHSASGPIPTKKNRLQSTKETAPSGETEADSEAADKDDDDHAANASAPSTTSKAEGVKVGQIRKRVRDLQWEGQEGAEDEGESHKKTLVDAEAVAQTEAEKAEGKSAKASDEVEGSKDPSGPSPAKSSARTQPSFSSFSSKPSAFSTAASTSSSSPFSAAAAASGGSRTQPTFSSFSSSTSPFSKGGADVAGPSWLAGSSSSKPLGASGASSSGPGLKPSALGSSLGKTKATSPPPAAPSPASASSAKVVASPKASSGVASKPASGGLGFGAFAGSNAFASAAKAAAAKGGQSNGALDSESQDNDDSKDSSDAGVRSPSAGASEAEVKEGKPKISALTEAELSTGEEDERSVFSARAKLYVMDPKDQSWKERGTGTLRCNVPRSYVGGRRKGARLVMRAEGVLRLILNVPLFAGMKVDPPQDKFVRLVALEEGEKMVHLAIKLSNPAGASNLYNVISEHIPEEGRSTATEVTAWEA